MESVQEFTSTEEREEGRRWRVFRIGEQEHRVDMKAIEPYKRVISHGGQWLLLSMPMCPVCYLHKDICTIQEVKLTVDETENIQSCFMMFSYILTLKTVLLMF